jgi:3-hydroxybutyryl-CoA dehydrogenase
MTERDASWPSKVAIVGAGTMGIGISHVFASNGIPTVLADTTAARAAAARERALLLLSRLEAEGHVEQGASSTAERCLSSASTIEEGVEGVDLIVEAVFERIDAKAAAYGVIETAARDDAVVATNTSSIRIARLAEHLQDPTRFLGVHWFVPPLLVPCVEVIPTRSTSERIVQHVLGALVRLGKNAVVVGDGPGFVANRIQFALFREAARIVEDGIATAEQIDEVVRSSFGFRLPFFGPFTIADMAGLDVYADIFDTLERDLGPSFSAPRILREHVERGEFGVKTGGGFLGISQAEGDALIDRRDRAYASLGRLRQEIEA